MNHKDITNNKANSDKKDPYGFFIYFFDEVRGHIPLFVYPKDLLRNETEKQILSVHSIWWHQDKFIESEKFSSIELEIGDILYAATLLFCKSKRKRLRSGMNALKWQYERFVLIVKAPSAVSFIAQEILHEFKKRIAKDLSNKLCVLVEKSMSGLDHKNHHGIIQKAKEVETELIDICETLTPNVPIAKLKKMMTEREENKELIVQRQKPLKQIQNLRFSIPSDTKSEYKKDKDKQLDKKRVKIINLKVNGKASLLLRNVGNVTLKNTVVKIYQSEGFFGKDIYKTQIEHWPPEKDVSIEFKPASNEGLIYFLKIEDEHETIVIRRIIG
ncbi:MAG: hypothetical protein ACTSR2_07575 [Candidatus Hodarchaeales archaeon]